METQVSKVTDIIFKAEPPRNINPWQHSWKTVFTSESGTVLSIPGFYNGDDKWVTRWSPIEEGVWTYITYSSLPALNGITGKITVIGVEKPNLSVIIDPNDPTKLSWSDGTPYFLIGFECDWLSLLDFDSKEIPKADKLMDGMAGNGFNHVVMNVYARDTEWPWVEGRGTEHDYANPPLWPFGGTWDSPDYSVLNPAFFQKLDQVMTGLQKRKIISHLMIYVWNKKVPWPKLGESEDNAYYDYIIARYQAYSNIVWDISKEAMLYGDCTNEFISERCTRTRKADAYNHLVTVHDRGYCETHPHMVDIMSTQTWSGDLYSNMKELSVKAPAKPVYNIEHGGYEECQYNVFPGDYVSAETCLERNYQCIFAGVYSTYYWQGCSWNIVIPEMESLDVEKRPKLEYFKYMADFFDRYPYVNYQVITRNPGSSGLWLTHKKDNRVLLFKPSGNYACHIGNGPQSPFKGQPLKSTSWFNPLTGEYRKISFKPAFSNEGHDENMGQWLEFKSPWGDGPAICVIEW